MPTPEEIIAAEAARVEAEKVTFTESQQAFINKLFDTRFSKIESKHNDELKRVNDKHNSDLEAAKVATAKKDTPGDEDANMKQLKDLLRTEQSKTVSEKARADVAEKHSKDTESAMQKVQKLNAIRDAASKQNFFELVTAVKLTEDSIVWSDEHNTFVVMVDGVVKQNSSLQPMSLEEFYTAYAAGHPYLVNGDVKAGAGSTHAGGTSGAGVVNTKADLKTWEQKSNYIDRYGLSAFEKLPIK